MGRQVDGRNVRSRRTRSVLVISCRELMAAGNYRPSMREIAKQADYSVRSGFEHFPTVEALHLEAAADDTVMAVILGRVMLAPPVNHMERVRLVRAIVLGRADPRP